jgi:hypothetical protein
MATPEEHPAPRTLREEKSALAGVASIIGVARHRFQSYSKKQAKTRDGQNPAKGTVASKVSRDIVCQCDTLTLPPTMPEQEFSLKRADFIAIMKIKKF